MDKKDILIVEDNDSMREMLVKAFSDAGFSVDEASNGEEAIAAATERTPNGILLDIILPKKDGFEVIKSIRSIQSAARIPIVLLTNLEGSSDVERALSLGATTYLVKSNYGLSEIVEKVRTCLSGS